MFALSGRRGEMMLSGGSGQEASSTMMHGVDPRMQQMKGSPPSSRILYDIPCKVCRDHSSGKHYGIFACDGCAGFFKRSIRRNRQYQCKAKSEGTCVVDKTHRNQCRACRLAKCQEAGMNKEAVQHERGPRSSTLRRQMALFLKDPNEMAPHPRLPALDLTMTHAPAPPPAALMPPHLFLSNPMTRFPFGLVMPPTNAMPAVITPETICESAARLLFMNVKWAKSVPAFTALPFSDQLLLLEETWSDLFVLGAAQFLVPLELGPLVQACTSINRPTESTMAMTLLHEVNIFQEALTRVAELHVDPHEFACLRAIVLFKTSFGSPVGSVASSSSSANSSDGKCLSSMAAVVNLQDHTQLTLNKYILATRPGQPLRYGKLLLLLPCLRAVPNTTIEELFFRRTIGNIPIVRIICDMYKANDV